MFARDRRKRTPARSKGRRKAPARRKPSPKSSGLALRNPFPSPLEQRHLDVIGLSLIALGLFLSLVLYLGWEGGSLGGGLVDAMTFLLGKVAWVIPVALLAAGGVLIARPMMPAVRPLRTGAICLGAGLLLLFAAQTAGIGPDRPLRPEFFDPAWVDEHGGMLGEGLFWVTNTLFQRVGSHIIAVLLLLAGGLLITGTSIATAVASSRRAIAQARHAGTGMAQTVYGRRGARTAPAPVPWADDEYDDPIIWTSPSRPASMSPRKRRRRPTPPRNRPRSPRMPRRATTTPTPRHSTLYRRLRARSRSFRRRASEKRRWARSEA